MASGCPGDLRLDVDDDLAASVAFLDRADGVGDLGERVDSVDDGGDFAGCHPLGDEFEVGLAGRRHHELEPRADEVVQQTGPEGSIHGRDPLAGWRSDAYIDTFRIQDATAGLQGMVSDAVEENVVALGALGEVGLGVVDDMVRSQGANHVYVASAGDTSHFGAQDPGDLDGVGTDASGCTIDEDLLAGLKVSVIAEALQRGEGGNGYGSCLFEGHIGGLQRKAGFGCAGEFGKGAAAHPEDGIAGLEMGHFGVNGFHFPGQVHAELLVFWVAEAGHEADAVGRSAEKMPVQRIDGGGADPDEDFVVSGRGFGDVGQLEDAGRAVLVVDDGLHR